MTKLSDMQRVLLSRASQREEGNVLPLTGTLASGGGRIDKSIAGLLTRGLIEERETSVAAEAVHRIDGDLRFGLFLTAAGAAAIGVSNDMGEGSEEVEDAGEGAASSPPAPAPEPTSKRSTKAAAVLALLHRTEGATLAELIAATGWLPHTTRAALTGLRKRGHAVERSKRDAATCYRIVAAG